MAVSYRIQGDEAFHHDVSDAAHEAKDLDDFYRGWRSAATNGCRNCARPETASSSRSSVCLPRCSAMISPARLMLKWLHSAFESLWALRKTFGRFIPRRATPYPWIYKYTFEASSRVVPANVALKGDQPGWIQCVAATGGG